MEVLWTYMATRCQRRINVFSLPKLPNGGKAYCLTWIQLVNLSSADVADNIYQALYFSYT